MILTGKASIDFHEWFKDRHTENYSITNLMVDLSELACNSIIIEWFDSVGIYIIP